MNLSIPAEELIAPLKDLCERVYKAINVTSVSQARPKENESGRFRRSGVILEKNQMTEGVKVLQGMQNDAES